MIKRSTEGRNAKCGWHDAAKRIRWTRYSQDAVTIDARVELLLRISTARKRMSRSSILLAVTSWLMAACNSDGVLTTNQRTGVDFGIAAATARTARPVCQPSISKAGLGSVNSRSPPQTHSMDWWLSATCRGERNAGHERRVDVPGRARGWRRCALQYVIALFAC